MNLIKLAKAGAKSTGEFPVVGPGWYAGNGGLFRLSGSSYDYKSEAGPVYDNGVVLICLNWMVRKLTQAKIQMQDTKDGKLWQPMDESDLDRAINRPNDFYTGHSLWGGALLSFLVNGNAYWLKRKDRAGRVIGYYYVYHRQIFPWADRTVQGERNDGTRLITRYEYHVPGGTIEDLEPDDLVHFRWPIPDPLNPALGLSPLASLLRQVCSHNEAVTFDAALLRNSGVPGIMLAPESGQASEPTPDQRTKLKDRIRQFVRDLRGEPLFFPFPVKLLSPAFRPKDMMVDKSRNLSAAEICAALGLDPMAVHLFSENKTYANFEEAREDAIESALLPHLSMLAEQITQVSFADFKISNPKQRLGFDLSSFRELQEDEDERQNRERENWLAGGTTRGEFRAAIGKTENVDDPTYYTDLKPGGQQEELPPEEKAMKQRARNRRKELERASAAPEG